jgi:hypothetical protein
MSGPTLASNTTVPQCKTVEPGFYSRVRSMTGVIANKKQPIFDGIAAVGALRFLEAVKATCGRQPTTTMIFAFNVI